MGTTAPGAGHPGSLWVDYNDGSPTTVNTIIYADTNGDGGADIAIRLSGHVDLTAADFVL
jgi:hypothetical protein